MRLDRLRGNGPPRPTTYRGVRRPAACLARRYSVNSCDSRCLAVRRLAGRGTGVAGRYLVEHDGSCADRSRLRGTPRLLTVCERWCVDAVLVSHRHPESLRRPESRCCCARVRCAMTPCAAVPVYAPVLAALRPVLALDRPACWTRPSTCTNSSLARSSRWGQPRSAPGCCRTGCRTRGIGCPAARHRSRIRRYRALAGSARSRLPGC